MVGTGTPPWVKIMAFVAGLFWLGCGHWMPYIDPRAAGNDQFDRAAAGSQRLTAHIDEPVDRVWRIGGILGRAQTVCRAMDQ